jgi:hypothetical protein
MTAARERRADAAAEESEGGASNARAAESATIARDVKFLRQSALLLPSAFLLDVLVFLLTHGRDDPGFGAYPFFQAWAGEGASSPESRFFEQALLFFIPAYVLALLFVLAVTLAERALFGKSRKLAPSRYGRAFAAAFPALFFAASVALMLVIERVALRQAPGSLVAPVLAAAAPFAAGGVALVPALVAAAPLAFLWKVAAA